MSGSVPNATNTWLQPRNKFVVHADSRVHVSVNQFFGSGPLLGLDTRPKLGLYSFLCRVNRPQKGTDMPTLAKISELKMELGNLRAEMAAAAVACRALDRFSADLALKFKAVEDRIAIIALDVVELAGTFQ